MTEQEYIELLVLASNRRREIGESSPLQILPGGDGSGDGLDAGPGKSGRKTVAGIDIYQTVRIRGAD